MASCELIVRHSKPRIWLSRAAISALSIGYDLGILSEDFVWRAVERLASFVARGSKVIARA